MKILIIEHYTPTATSGTVFTCAKCGLRISGGTYVNGILVCDWCLPKASK